MELDSSQTGEGKNTEYINIQNFQERCQAGPRRFDRAGNPI